MKNNDPIREFNPDVVLFHSGWAQLLFAPTVHERGVPFARYIHGLPSRFDLMDRLAMRNSPRLLITGETRSDRLREIQAAQIPVLYKPVSPEQLREAMMAVWTSSGRTA